MDSSAPTHERRKLVKIYNNVLSRKWTVFIKVCVETYSKIIKKMEEKNDHRLNKKHSENAITFMSMSLKVRKKIFK